MNNRYLESITIRFPNDLEFAIQLLTLLGMVGRDEGGCFKLTSSSPGFYPRLFLKFVPDIKDVWADFTLSNKQITSVKIENSSGIERPSPHFYDSVTAVEVIRRLASAGLKLVSIDHLGINLPWFASELHPQISSLRTTFSTACLYHQYPTGEAWDFILPGDLDEILYRKAIDYAKVRKPKFELVSFNKTSKPLVQIDVGMLASYEKLVQLFPESLKDPQFGNIWIYLENQYKIDVCLVVNPFSDRDWSDYFKEFRL